MHITFDSGWISAVMDLISVGTLAYLWYRIESIQAGVDYITDTIDNEEDYE